MINIKNLAKALKNKSAVRWIKRDGFNIILTDYFVLRTNKAIDGSALTALVKILGGIPQEGKVLGYRSGILFELINAEIEDTIKFLNISYSYRKVEFTNLIRQSDKLLLSIFKTNENYIYVDKAYIDLVDLYKKDIEVMGYTTTTPIYFSCNNEKVMVLPIRISGQPDFLKEI